MTELLHPAQPYPARTSPAPPGLTPTGPDRPAPASSADGTSGIPGGLDRAVPLTGATRDHRSHEALAAAEDFGTLSADARSASDIEGVSTRHLRILANRAYQLMDSDYPQVGAVEAYAMFVDELDVRAQQARRDGPTRPLRETFRDNPLYGRFELLVDGALAVYIKYTMTGGRVVLTDGVEHPEFRDQGIDALLMRHIVLNAHKRRLSLMPQCPMAFAFLADHPEYQALTAQPDPS